MKTAVGYSLLYGAVFSLIITGVVFGASSYVNHTVAIPWESDDIYVVGSFCLEGMAPFFLIRMALPGLNKIAFGTMTGLLTPAFVYGGMLLLAFLAGEAHAFLSSTNAESWYALGTGYLSFALAGWFAGLVVLPFTPSKRAPA